MTRQVDSLFFLLADRHNRTMSRGEEKTKRWQVNLRDMAVVTAGICLSIRFLKLAFGSGLDAEPLLLGWFLLCGSTGWLYGRIRHGTTDEAHAFGCLFGVLGVFVPLLCLRLYGIVLGYL